MLNSMSRYGRVVCVCRYGTMCAIACVWRAKDNFKGQSSNSALL